MQVHATVYHLQLSDANLCENKNGLYQQASTPQQGQIPAYCLCCTNPGAVSRCRIYSTLLLISIFDYTKEFSWFAGPFWEPSLISTDEDYSDHNNVVIGWVAHVEITGRLVWMQVVSVLNE